MSATGEGPRMLRVAVVGAGPTGWCSAVQLLSRNAIGRSVRVDLLDRDPAPYGIPRSGVTQSRPEIESICARAVNLEPHQGLRLFVGVEVGVALSHRELASRYDAMIYATGASCNRRLGIPFDERNGVLRNVNGRVIDPESGDPVPGVYTAGWAKGGGSAMVGGREKSARDTVALLFADHAAGRLPTPFREDDLAALLTERHRAAPRPDWSQPSAGSELGGAGGVERRAVAPAAWDEQRRRSSMGYAVAQRCRGSMDDTWTELGSADDFYLGPAEGARDAAELSDSESTGWWGTTVPAVGGFPEGGTS